MRLSCRMLENVKSVNDFDVVERSEFTEGDTPTLYLQLVDASKDRGLTPPGRRFVPAAGATLSLVFDNVDDSRKVTRFASQPYAQDPSIWAVTVMSTDKLLGTVNLKLTLTEGAKVTYGFVAAAVGVQSMSGVIL